MQHIDYKSLLSIYKTNARGVPKMVDGKRQKVLLCLFYYRLGLYNSIYIYENRKKNNQGNKPN